MQAQATISVRQPPTRFEEPIPRHWFGGVAIATQLANGVNMLFPAGERFFIRSVRKYMDAIDDPKLQAEVKAFFGQEGRHAQAHERFFEVMREQGYEIDDFLERYQHIAFGVIEPLASPELRLAVTVALEHFTAIMAEDALTNGMLELAHPELRKLLYWHAAEEIEHKAVAFDVLKQVNPSYALRIAGLIMATACLSGFWVAATLNLVLQDKKRGEQSMFKAWRRLPRRESIAERIFLRGIKAYLRRDFHPSQMDNAHLAHDYLASAGLA